MVREKNNFHIIVDLKDNIRIGFVDLSYELEYFPDVIDPLIFKVD
jgi:hypothetical protein